MRKRVHVHVFATERQRLSNIYSEVIRVQMVWKHFFEHCRNLFVLAYVCVRDVSQKLCRLLYKLLFQFQAILLLFQVMSKQTQVKGIDANEKEGEGGQIGRASLRRLRKVSNVE